MDSEEKFERQGSQEEHLPTAPAPTRDDVPRAEVTDKEVPASNSP